MIVVDASALTAFILKEAGWKRLAKYMIRAISVDHVLKETANAIWKAYLAERLTREEAREALEILRMLAGKNTQLAREEDYLEQALEISLENKITIYDSLYIALAKTIQAPLLTLDTRQKETAEKTGVKTINPSIAL